MQYLWKNLDRLELRQYGLRGERVLQEREWRAAMRKENRGIRWVFTNFFTLVKYSARIQIHREHEGVKAPARLMHGKHERNPAKPVSTRESSAQLFICLSLATELAFVIVTVSLSLSHAFASA